MSLKQVLHNNQYRVPMEEMEMNPVRRLNPWKFLKSWNHGSRDFWIRTPTWQLHKSVTINLWNRYRNERNTNMINIRNIFEIIIVHFCLVKFTFVSWTFQVLALVYHLVKFGYYAEKEDIIRLLPSLLDLVDGTDDDPFPVPEGIIMKKIHL